MGANSYVCKSYSGKTDRRWWLFAPLPPSLLLPLWVGLINLNDIFKVKTNTKFFMHKETWVKQPWYNDITYSTWKKLFWYKKNVFTPIKTTKNRRCNSLLSEDVLSYRFLICWSRLLKPLSTTVLVKPLSQRHFGHFYCNPSSTSNKKGTLNLCLNARLWNFFHLALYFLDIFR